MPSSFIQWFPGHMTKAIRMMKEEIKPVDCVIYVLDSRIPMSSVNPAFDEIIGNKPRLYVLNKCDLVAQNDLIPWKNYFGSMQNCSCVIADSTKKADNKIISELKKLNEDKIKRFSERGIRKTIRAMVIGVPNCGKSTLINSLIGKKRAITGNRPGVTRGKQWVTVDTYVEVLDTPGTLYPDFSDQKKALHLSFVGSVKDDVVDLHIVANELFAFLAENYPQNLTDKYGENCSDIVSFAQKRGYFLKGNELDLDRAAKAVIGDFRKNAFGKIILEKRL